MSAGVRRGRPRRPDALTDAEALEDLCARADEAGEARATVRALASAWGWSVGRVSQFTAPYRDARTGALCAVHNSLNYEQTPRRPVLRYHGGKWRLAPWIIEHFPDHAIYTESFGGAGSVLMRKPRCKGEVYNDLDGEMSNLFRVLRSPASRVRLQRMLEATPFARDEFAASYAPAEGEVEQARRTVVRSFMGFGSDSASGAQTGFRAKTWANSAPASRDWGNYAPALASFGERLRGVVIENRPADAVIRQHDGPQMLHYVDPPYPHQTRSKHVTRTGKGYRHEMSAEDHESLAEVLNGVDGFVVLSGYACPLYDEDLYRGWPRVTRRALADGGQARTEVLWINPKAWAALGRDPAISDTGADLFGSRAA